jgi:hypothetical protein
MFRRVQDLRAHLGDTRAACLVFPLPLHPASTLWLWSHFTLALITAVVLGPGFRGFGTLHRLGDCFPRTQVPDQG